MDKIIIYQMLPRLWGDRTGVPTRGGSLSVNGCGRFSSVDGPTLEYLRSMGVTHLWLTGVVRHATAEDGGGCRPSSPQWVKGRAGSPYSITDWFDVNPYLADNPEKRMEEFETLVARVHAAGLRLLIDYVPNHVARDYGAFSPRPFSGGLDAAGHPVFGALDDPMVHWSPENDFFYYPGQELVLPVAPPEGCPPYREFPARASGNCFTPAPGVGDWYDTVKLNYCDFRTPTWDKMLGVLLFWLEKGVDGFRCDMVELVPPEFCKWLIGSVKEKYPECLFVAEVYQKQLYEKYVREVGFDLLYDKSGLYDTLWDIIRRNAEGSPAPVVPWQSAMRITWNWQETGGLQGHLLNFLENHDERRLASDFFAGSGSAALAAAHVSALFNTSSFMLYFGQEVGERGMDTEGMSGLDGRTTIFDWWAPAGLQRLWAHVHGDGEALLPEEKALMERYRKVLGLAISEPALRRGEVYDLCYCNLESPGFDRDRHFGFLRSDGKKIFLIVSNFASAPARITLRIPSDAFMWLGFKGRGPETVTVEAPARDGVIMKI